MAKHTPCLLRLLGLQALCSLSLADGHASAVPMGSTALLLWLIWTRMIPDPPIMALWLYSKQGQLALELRARWSKGATHVRL